MIPALKVRAVEDDLAALVREVLSALQERPADLAALLVGMCPERLIGADEFRALLGDISPAALDRLVARRAVPSPIKLGGLRRWPLSDIRAWIRAGCPSEGGDRPRRR